MSHPTEEIYNTYKKPIYNYFYRMTFSSHTSEELTHDTFLKAFKYFSTFRGDSSVKTWLFTIARNTYITYVKRCGYVKEENLEDYEAADQNHAFSDSDKKILVKKVLSKLTEEEKSLILLRDLNGLTYHEISKIMEYTEGKVKIGLHRARNKFRTYYNKEVKED